MHLSELSHIWDIIVKSNTFNFIIFVAIFTLIFKKINIKGVLDSLQSKLVDLIESAKNAKDEALKELKDVEVLVENLPQVLDEMVADAKKTAETIKEKILKDAQVQVQHIEQNAIKVIGAEEKMLISKLTHKTSIASVEVAKSNIEQALKSNPQLHEKYINESIDSLDRLNF